MNTIEQQLSELRLEAPATLGSSTLVETGAADLVSRADSPVGPIWVAWSPRGVTAITPLFAEGSIDDFFDHHRRRSYPADRLPRDLSAALTAGLESGDTSAVPVDLVGIAPFQRSVLMACATIPVGSVRPYGWIADEIGNPGSVRAVGTALGRNPIPLVVPCHRVVRSDGSIGNYAFGADMKHELLVREGAILA
jgi:O-6-methylguanine DNA methyltransferase